MEKPPRHSLQNIKAKRERGRQPPKPKGQKKKNKEKKSIGEYVVKGFEIFRRVAMAMAQSLH